LHRLEKGLLEALNESTGNILEDEKVLKTLETLKNEANDISDRVAETDEILVEVEAVTSVYEPLAEKCSLIYMTINQLEAVDPIYLFSLEFFFEIFDFILRKDDSISLDFQTRILQLEEGIFWHFFKFIAVSLWNEDVPLYALMLARIKGASLSWTGRGCICLNANASLVKIN